jgi:uncharacterized protein (DUF4415 family)
MRDHTIKRASLAEIKRMKVKGELFHDPSAAESETLGLDFWAGAKIEGPRKSRSVHLKLDPEVFAHFYAESGGKGHLTKMQAVLKAYAMAHRQSNPR